MKRKKSRRASIGTRPVKAAAPAPTVLKPGRKEWLAILLLFIAVWLVTANSLGSAFILDDDSKIVGNTDIRRLSELPSRLIYPYERNQVLERNDPSRPLVFLVYGVIYHFFGLNPVPYHAANALFHFASATLVFLLTQVMLLHLSGTRKLLAPLLVALFFLVTPVQVGTVVYAYALNDVLCSFLMLLSIYGFVRRPSPRPLDVAASVLAMGLALLTKQSAIVTPLVILAFDFFIIGRMNGQAQKARLRLYVAYLGLMGVYFAYRFWYFGALGDIEGRGNTHPALAYFFTQPVVILKYLFSSIVPWHLAIDHYLVPRNFGPVVKGLALLFLLLLVVPAGHLWKKRSPAARLVLFSACFYFVVLAPTSSLLPTVDIMVERRVYLANMGLFLLVVIGWDMTASVGLFSAAASRIGLGLVCAHLVALAGVSVHRNQIYSTNEGAWLDVLKVYPASERALNNLGNVYLDRKAYDRAKECFEQLIARNAADYIAQQNLGAIYERPDSPFHDEEMALAHFKAAVAANPDFAEAHYNLGRLYQKTAQSKADAGLVEEATKCYERALALNPAHVLAHNNLGLIYYHQGKRNDARREYEAALRLDPNCEPAKANMRLLDTPSPGPAGASAVPLSDVPREMLIRLYEDALRRDPKNAQIRQKYNELMGTAPR
jgi:protein O-mannosyl-transferase